ncbi:hypothetical protein GCM10022267_01320 [Lentzea roselyniae]|uniref:Uncharacterized protein n=1 Tax=Lentzea roselyniae TaxID=531940 RepID=A0ABP6ZYX5_9PSEU
MVGRRWQQHHLRHADHLARHLGDRDQRRADDLLEVPLHSGGIGNAKDVGVELDVAFGVGQAQPDEGGHIPALGRSEVRAHLTHDPREARKAGRMAA